jgi:hypothetical protein
MEWCLACHREPERFLRDRKEVFNMSYNAPNALSENKTPESLQHARELKAEYKVRSAAVLTSCSTCHR